MWHVKFSESMKYSPKTIVLIQGRTRMSQSPLSSILKTSMAKATIVMPIDVLRKRSNELSKAGRQQGNHADDAENNVDQKLKL